MSSSPTQAPAQPSKPWYDKVLGFIRHAAVSISHGFEKLVGHDNAVNFGHDAMAILKTTGGQIVMGAVQAAEVEFGPNGSGADKHALAQSLALPKLESAGLTVSKSLVNLLIETAVAALRGDVIAAAL
ncbi:MAG TPA: phage holin, LLH family [Terriglobia bacterium]|nr:phage holin, LLH family [Terriglobia bacterium]